MVVTAIVETGTTTAEATAVAMVIAAVIQTITIASRRRQPRVRLRRQRQERPQLVPLVARLQQTTVPSMLSTTGLIHMRPTVAIRTMSPITNTISRCSSSSNNSSNSPIVPLPHRPQAAPRRHLRLLVLVLLLRRPEDIVL